MAKQQKAKKPQPVNPRKLKKQLEDEAMQNLLQRISELDALPTPELPELLKFDDLPLSLPTRKGLKDAHFTDLTEIQKECIIPALAKHDILAAARTGSGKTLGFLIPVLERLYYEKWTQLDGLGGLIITPTRELALQIFEVLRKIGRNHTLSAGLLIGGKNVQAEKERVGRLNILVCTPGRLLQHMDESPGFDCNNLQLLVLDEADRIMDMGFKKTVDAIVDNLPPQRQTMLFSATQTKNVSDLARLSLSKPKYISVVDPENPNAIVGGAPTPKTLEQFYTKVPLDKKLDMLWSFLRSHLKNKILVFFSSSKQVRFVYESFRRMQPGIPLMHLNGRQKQTSRMETTAKFMNSRASCLFATDVVARGIDFPEIEWVVQVDCPEDVATYIHRVGRSARAGKNGKALLFLSEPELKFVANLEARKIPITEINIKESQRLSVQQDLQGQLFQDPDLKYLAQKAFVSYVRSVYLQHDKEVFDVEKIPLEEFAKSLGLASAPNVKIRGNAKASKDLKNLPRALRENRGVKESDRDVKTKYDRIFSRQNQGVLSEHYKKLAAKDDDGDEEDDFLNVKRRDHDLELESDASDGDANDNIDTKDIGDTDGPASKRALKRALSKKQSVLSSGKVSTKLVFDEEGKAHPLYEFENEEDFQSAGKPEEQREKFVSTELQEMEERDMLDKETLKQRRQEKKRHRKEMERLAREGGGSGSDDDDDDVDDIDNLPRLPSDNEISSESESEVETPARKKQKQNVLEVEEPETLEDLEALTTKLLGH